MVFSNYLPDTVEVVFLPRLAQLLVNARLWRDASAEERRSIVARLAGAPGAAGGHVWGWASQGEVAELARPLQSISPTAWEQMLPID